MASEIQRWAQSPIYLDEMIEHDSGDFVNYEDHAAALAERDAEIEQKNEHLLNCDKRIENQRREIAGMLHIVKMSDDFVQSYRDALGRNDGLTAIKELQSALTAANAEIARLKAQGAGT